MCGRIAQAHTVEELEELVGVHIGSDELHGVRMNFNVPPTSVLPTVVADEEGLRWKAFKWGFSPVWMRKGRPMINARSETVREKPMFKRAIRHRRCVVSASAYYEWQRTPDGKQPYCIKMADDFPLLMAGIYENETCAILTRAAREEFEYIHDRMPVLLTRESLQAYVTSVESLPAVVSEAEELPLHAFKVTKQVGHPRFNGSECMEALP